MTVGEAARRLRAMYDDLATGRAVSVHLFGIRYADELQGMNLKEIAIRAEIAETYSTEIREGVTLARYVLER